MRLLILFVLFQSLFSCANTEEQVVENQFTAESDTNYLGFNTIIFDYISFVDTIITNEEYLNLIIPKGYTIAKSTHWKCVGAEMAVSNATYGVTYRTNLQIPYTKRG